MHAHRGRQRRRGCSRWACGCGAGCRPCGSCRENARESVPSEFCSADARSASTCDARAAVCRVWVRVWVRVRCWGGDPHPSSAIALEHSSTERNSCDQSAMAAAAAIEQGPRAASRAAWLWEGKGRRVYGSGVAAWFPHHECELFLPVDVDVHDRIPRADDPVDGAHCAAEELRDELVGGGERQAAHVHAAGVAGRLLGHRLPARHSGEAAGGQSAAGEAAEESAREATWEAADDAGEAWNGAEGWGRDRLACGTRREGRREGKWRSSGLGIAACVCGGSAARRLWRERDAHPDREKADSALTLRETWQHRSSCRWEK